ncbi:2-amino-4-hydroxy-6-hydroxymethyldihydropteridinediphosphokinase [Ferrimonas sediminum]|uniref:2-amino-4-hydroxy-6-hydroxymethyldihydropteridine pyrophosphokinase n=1 Tax=Ferrimonas sediminum TaxID=718193 RepID=A0A1G8YPW6_9GAMM|nr:2-amino-4-hydroxy-6-hydroxymethyldihydropteridine diphosphokinase [Ferrimonas sediminum]SDK04813.1 2-amino-4-hydroxy-6-hydroxymethyldihydropteridinediphosphokinase [Ferrimonas sediminum]
MPEQRYYCSFGANLNPEANAVLALTALSRRFSPIVLSSIIKTAPAAMESEHQFLNFAFWFDSTLSAGEVKSVFNQLEIAQGRDRSDPDCSIKDRPLDLDILSVNQAPSPAQHPEYLTPLLDQLTGSSRPVTGICLAKHGLELGHRATTIHRDSGSGHIRVVDQHP